MTPATNSSLTELVPGLADIDRQIADNDTLKEKVGAARQEHDATLATWRAECRSAVLADKHPPAEPERPKILVAVDPATLDSEGLRLRRQRRTLIADHADELILALREREQHVIDRVRERLGDLEPDLTELRAIGAELVDVVYAHNANLKVGNQRWYPPHPDRLTEHAVLAAVLDPTKSAIG